MGGSGARGTKTSGTRATETRRRILDAAVPLFAAGGLRGTSIAGVARSVGVSPATVFSYYESKDALLAAAVLHDSQGLHRDALEAMGERTGDPIIGDRWRLLWTALSDGLERHPLTRRMLLKPEIGVIRDVLSAPPVYAASGSSWPRSPRPRSPGRSVPTWTRRRRASAS